MRRSVIRRLSWFGDAAITDGALAGVIGEIGGGGEWGRAFYRRPEALAGYAVFRGLRLACCVTNVRRTALILV